jgi:KUP system potassium uptake protein
MTNAQAFSTPVAPSETAASAHRRDALPVLVLGALGVVYGDIGTSPIYAFRQALTATGPGPITEPNVLGLLSLIAWSLTLVVSLKYVLFVTRADNRGEGGILALTALARSNFVRRPFWILALGVVGAALFLGDSTITPAISVLSAVEGLETVAPSLSEFVLPATICILLVLFAVQRFGTAKVSSIFGPVVIVWFAALGLSGIAHIAQDPVVLWALDPLQGARFLIGHLGIAAAVIGAIFLAVTGAEALYADMGHLGRNPIAIAWFGLVFPCLLLNYFGQGAFVLSGDIHAPSDPFFLMFPAWGRIAMVGLTTAATVIASQAVISGTYSLMQQAMALNIVPRLTLLHTSETQSGQIYMPQVNTMLLIAVLMLVVGFKSSDALSSAYGIAVSGVMLLTTILISIVIWRGWKWHPAAVAAAMTPFILIDAGFFVANAGKFADGGWVPALFATALTALMFVWIAGRRRLSEKTRRDEVPLQFLVDNLTKKRPVIVPGTAMFLTSDVDGAPTALLHSLKHYKVLHEHNVILTVVTANVPRVPDDEKIRIESLSPLFDRVVLTFGFVETPNIPQALVLARKLGWKFDIMSTSFFLSRRSLKPSPKGGLMFWVDRLFIGLSRNATDATEYFHIPTGRVVEIGTQVLL